MGRYSIYLILFGIWSGGVFAFVISHNAAPAPLVQFEVTAEQDKAKKDLEKSIKTYERRERKLDEEILRAQARRDQLEKELSSMTARGKK